MLTWCRRRYAVRKFSKITGAWIREPAPAPLERLFWTWKEAARTAERLNEAMRLYDPRAEFRVMNRWKVPSYEVQRW